MVSRGGVGGDWMKVVKRYKLSVIRYINTRDVIENMMIVTLIYDMYES